MSARESGSDRKRQQTPQKKGVRSRSVRWYKGQTATERAAIKGAIVAGFIGGAFLLLASVLEGNVIIFRDIFHIGNDSRSEPTPTALMPTADTESQTHIPNSSYEDNPSQLSDLAIVTTEGGHSVTDACFVLVGVTNVGCDENRDGRVWFADVPWGTYTVHQTADLGPGRQVHDFVIQVRGKADSTGWETFTATIENSATDTVNVSGEATILMSFRACPEEFDPMVQDFFAYCTVPLDAPDASFINWDSDPEVDVNISGLDRQDDGTYIFTAGPTTMNLVIGGLAPVVRDLYKVVGAGTGMGDIYTVQHFNGETREIFVFYYYL